MEINIDQKAAWTVVAVSGRIDSFNQEIVRTKLDNLRRIGKKKIALEISHSEYLGLPILLFLASLDRELTSSQGMLAIVGANAKNRKHISMLGQLEDNRILESLEELEG